MIADLKYSFGVAPSRSSLIGYNRKEFSNIAGVGMAGNIFGVLGIIRAYPGKTLYIDSGGLKTFVSEDAPIKGTTNFWEYYFDQNESGLVEATISGLDYHKEYLHDSEEIMGVSTDFWKSFTLKKDMELTNIGDNVLGVHIRYSDMTYKRPASEYIKRIKEIREQVHVESIFLATDDSIISNELHEKIDLPIQELNSFRCSSNTEFGRFDCDRPLHRYLMGKEVILDMLTLARCKYFLRSPVASVSQCATILSKNIVQTYTL
jgi:hypothetical protein